NFSTSMITRFQRQSLAAATFTNPGAGRSSHSMGFELEPFASPGNFGETTTGSVGFTFGGLIEGSFGLTAGVFTTDSFGMTFGVGFGVGVGVATGSTLRRTFSGSTTGSGCFSTRGEVPDSFGRGQNMKRAAPTATRRIVAAANR